MHGPARERDGRARRRLYWGSALTRWMDHRIDYMVCKCFIVCERESYTHNMLTCGRVSGVTCGRLRVAGAGAHTMARRASRRAHGRAARSRRHSRTGRARAERESVRGGGGANLRVSSTSSQVTYVNGRSNMKACHRAPPNAQRGTRGKRHRTHPRHATAEPHSESQVHGPKRVRRHRARSACCSLSQRGSAERAGGPAAAAR